MSIYVCGCYSMLLQDYILCIRPNKQFKNKEKNLEKNISMCKVFER